MKTDKARDLALKPIGTYREFFVAETLKGELHIFRENHQGGGLTKFVEYCAVEQLEQKIKDSNAVWEKLEREFYLKNEQLEKELKFYKDYYSQCSKDDYDKLQAKLKIARDAATALLEILADVDTSSNSYLKVAELGDKESELRKALKQLEKVEG